MPDSLSRPIAVLGATSRLASDFLLSSAGTGLCFALYARRPEAVASLLREHGLPPDWNGGTLTDFADHIRLSAQDFRAVLNFVGVGDPAKALRMGADIFEATLASDRLALDLLERAPGTPYVFMSSGAVYGTQFDAPAGAGTPAIIPINEMMPQDFYSVAKLHAEAVHRSCQGATIIDLRIFNYVSRWLDPDSRFIVSDMIRAVRQGSVFETADVPMYRDFLHPEGFRDLLMVCLAAPPGTNRPIDAYSRAPIAKRELLELMAAEFGMRYRFTEQPSLLNATGAKPFYYSQNCAAAELGYSPLYSSAEAIRAEVGAVLGGQTSRPPAMRPQP